MREMKMPKLILMFAAALLVGLCAQSGAYAQTDEGVAPPPADQPEATDQGQGVQEDTGQSTDDNAEAPTDEGAASDMPPDEDTEQQPNDANGQ
jgi:hypothetical protein